MCVEVRLGCDPVESVDSDSGLVVEGALSVRLTDYSVHVEGIIWQRNAGGIEDHNLEFGLDKVSALLSSMFAIRAYKIK